MHRVTASVVLTIMIVSACSAPSPRASGGDHVVVIARDFAFDAPDSVPAGLVQFTLRNAGPSFHHLQVVRLATDLEFAAVRDTLMRAEALPAWLVPVGGAEGPDSLPRPVTVTIRVTPGRYLLLCRITTPERRIHYMLGMLRPLIVTASGELPATTLPSATEIRLRDFAFETPDSLPAGPRVFAARNHGTIEHAVAIARLAPGASLEAVRHAAPGPSTLYQILSGTAGLAPNEVNWLHVSLTPGNYLLMCLVEDPVTHREHQQLGMIRRLTIVP